MLTLQELKDMKPGEVFAQGMTTNDSEGVHMTNHRYGDNMFWIAKRGNIEDWAIYVGWVEWGLEKVERVGDKVYDAKNIKKLVPCDDEAFKMYRY